ncbi:unnamed protein product, partial [Arabidopsis halleri]
MVWGSSRSTVALVEAATAEVGGGFGGCSLFGVVVNGRSSWILKDDAGARVQKVWVSSAFWIRRVFAST